jgi:hypothetical protein
MLTCTSDHRPALDHGGAAAPGPVCNVDDKLEGPSIIKRQASRRLEGKPDNIDRLTGCRIRTFVSVIAPVWNIEEILVPERTVWHS